MSWAVLKHSILQFNESASRYLPTNPITADLLQKSNRRQSLQPNVSQGYPNVYERQGRLDRGCCTLYATKYVSPIRAASLTVPAHGQGASSSIEDAAALGVLFEGATSDEITSRLELFQSMRHPRATATQAMSNYMMMGGPKMIEEARKYYDGPLPPPGSKTSSQPFCDFFFQYNVFEEAKQILEARR